MDHIIKPRLARIIRTDWPALFCLIAIPIVWLIGLVFPFIRRVAQFGPFEIPTIAVPIHFLAGGFLFWRIVRIFRLFRNGHLISARITRLQIVRDRGPLEFTYAFGGQTFSSWMPVHKNEQVLALHPNQEVEVLVDPTRPTNAIVRDLFL